MCARELNPSCLLHRCGASLALHKLCTNTNTQAQRQPRQTLQPAPAPLQPFKPPQTFSSRRARPTRSRLA
jgi:hypothetical protein